MAYIDLIKARTGFVASLEPTVPGTSLEAPFTGPSGVLAGLRTADEVVYSATGGPIANGPRYTFSGAGKVWSDHTNLDNTPSEFTIAAWIEPSALPASGVVATTGRTYTPASDATGPFYLGVQDTGVLKRVVFRVYDANEVDSVSLAFEVADLLTGGPRRIAGSCVAGGGADNVKLLIDGVQVAVGTLVGSGVLHAVEGDFVVGFDPTRSETTDTGFFFSGDIAHVDYFMGAGSAWDEADAAQDMIDAGYAAPGETADTIAGTLYDVDGVTPVTTGHAAVLNADTRALVTSAAVSDGTYTFGSLTPDQQYVLAGWNAAGTLVKAEIVTPEVAA